MDKVETLLKELQLKVSRKVLSAGFRVVIVNWPRCG